MILLLYYKELFKAMILSLQLQDNQLQLPYIIWSGILCEK